MCSVIDADLPYVDHLNGLLKIMKGFESDIEGVILCYFAVLEKLRKVCRAVCPLM